MKQGSHIHIIAAGSGGATIEEQIKDEEAYKRLLKEIKQIDAEHKAEADAAIRIEEQKREAAKQQWEKNDRKGKPGK